MRRLYHFRSAKASISRASIVAFAFTIHRIDLTIQQSFAGLLNALPIPSAKEPNHEQIEMKTLTQVEDEETCFGFLQTSQG